MAGSAETPGRRLPRVLHKLCNASLSHWHFLTINVFITLIPAIPVIGTIVGFIVGGKIVVVLFLMFGRMAGLVVYGDADSLSFNIVFAVIGAIVGFFVSAVVAGSLALMADMRQILRRIEARGPR